MIGISENFLRDAPGVIPLQHLLVDQHAHQLRDGNGRMGVIELNGHFVRQILPTSVGSFLEAPDHVLDGGRYEKVLLLEAQFASRRLII